jgi:hypothetical protein
MREEKAAKVTPEMVEAATKVYTAQTGLSYSPAMKAALEAALRARDAAPAPMTDPGELPAFIREAVTCAQWECQTRGCAQCWLRRDAVRRVLEGLAQEYEGQAKGWKGEGYKLKLAERLRGWAAALEHS